MKIHSIRQQLGERRIAGAAGVLAICGAAILGVTNCSIASAKAYPPTAKQLSLEQRAGNPSDASSPTGIRRFA